MNNNQKRSVEEWWSEIPVRRKQMLRLVENMMENLREGQVLEARIKADGLFVAEVVNRAESQGAEAESNFGLWRPGPGWIGGPGK